MSNKKKGSDKERNLVDLFYDENFGVMRSPGSGGGTKREEPDVLAGHNEKDLVITIEAKYSGDDYCYVDEQEVEDLKKFSENFGTDKCRLGFRFNYKSWYFFNPKDLERTKSGKYKMKRENVEEGESFEELISN